MAEKKDWWKPEPAWPVPENKGKDVVVTGAKLIDGNGGPVTDNPVIVIKGERIVAVGTKDKVKIPPGAEVIDAAGCTLMPGMMDCHIHTAMFNCMTFHNHRVAQWEVTPQLQQMYSLFHAQNCVIAIFKASPRINGVNPALNVADHESPSERCSHVNPNAKIITVPAKSER